MHLNDSVRVEEHARDDLQGEEHAACPPPGHREHTEHVVPGAAPAQADAQLVQVQRDVRHVVEHRCQHADPRVVAGEGEHQQSDREQVVHQDQEEVLSAGLEEVSEGDAPVEAESHHVVAPHVGVQLELRVANPAVSNVIQPCFVS